MQICNIVINIFNGRSIMQRWHTDGKQIQNEVVVDFFSFRCDFFVYIRNVCM